MNAQERRQFYLAHLHRDGRYDGKFFVAVKTTKIYCRPICPARKAKLKNLEFFRLAVQAEQAGYRPCLRCRPEAAPGSPAWLGTSATVRRALRMMETKAGELSVSDIALKLGISERWLRELFSKEISLSPQAVLLMKKLDTAFRLVNGSSRPMTEIAFEAGFQSVRRFNDAFKRRFHQSPTAFRRNASQKERNRP